MSLVYHRAPASTAGLTDHVIAELDVPHEIVTHDLRARSTRTPEFLRVNPNGKVPAVVHDGTAVWESAAVTLYLGETFGVERGLWPDAGPKRGEAMRWVVWANVTLGDAIARWARGAKGWVPADEQTAKATEVGLADLHDRLAILDGALADRAFLCGAYTLADTHVNALVDWLGRLDVDVARHARVDAWNRRCAERPAHRRVIAAASVG